MSDNNDNHDNRSILTHMSQDENKDTIRNRIKFVRTLLEDNDLKPMVDFSDLNTETFINKSRDSDSGGSYNTRVSLKKEIHDITNIIDKIGGTLKYFKSGTTGHTFRGIEMDNNNNIIYEYAVKVVPYSIKDKYGSALDTRRPENAELMMIKLLSYFVVKEITPHIVLPIGTFDTDITHFTDLIEKGFITKGDTKSKNNSYKKYCEFVSRYKKGEFYNEVSILISEWADKGDLSSFIKKYYQNFTTLHWKVIFFQIISTLAVIQFKYPTFRHNDLKANNILVTKSNKTVPSYTYTVSSNEYDVPNIGYQIKLWDFDFACIPGIVDNMKVLISCPWSRKINVGLAQNRYYDIHFFFNTLVRKQGFFPELMDSDVIAQEVKDFNLSIVPKEYQEGNTVSEGGRILHNMEYVIPSDILKNNPFFAEFRRNNYQSSSINKQYIRKGDINNNDLLFTSVGSSYRSRSNSVKKSKMSGFLKGGSKTTHGKQSKKKSRDKTSNKKEKDRTKKIVKELTKSIIINDKKKKTKKRENTSRKNKE